MYVHGRVHKNVRELQSLTRKLYHQSYFMVCQFLTWKKRIDKKVLTYFGHKVVSKLVVDRIMVYYYFHSQNH